MRPHEAAVADAGPLIHLNELGVLSVLNCYDRVWVPATVGMEADRHQPTWRSGKPSCVQVVEVSHDDIRSLPAEVTSGLDPGEIESLAFWFKHRDSTILCDDLKARGAARGLGAPVIGTIGLLIKAVRLGRMDATRVVSLLRSIPDKTTMHISRILIDDALKEVSRAFGLDE